MRRLIDRMRAWKLRRTAERLARRSLDRKVFCEPTLRDDDSTRQLRLRAGARP